MMSEDLVKRVEDLKNALGMIESELASEETPPQGLADFKAAVDSIRLSVWAILTAAHSDDYDRYIGKYRLRRLTEMMGSMVADAEADAIPRATDEFQAFCAVLADLSERFLPNSGRSVPEPLREGVKFRVRP
jgi:hypothetical protein